MYDTCYELTRQLPPYEDLRELSQKLRLGETHGEKMTYVSGNSRTHTFFIKNYQGLPSCIIFKDFILVKPPVPPLPSAFRSLEYLHRFDKLFFTLLF